VLAITLKLNLNQANLIAGALRADLADLDLTIQNHVTGTSLYDGDFDKLVADADDLRRLLVAGGGFTS